MPRSAPGARRTEESNQSGHETNDDDHRQERAEARDHDDAGVRGEAAGDDGDRPEHQTRRGEPLDANGHRLVIGIASGCEQRTPHTAEADDRGDDRRDLHDEDDVADVVRLNRSRTTRAR